MEPWETRVPCNREFGIPVGGGARARSLLLSPRPFSRCCRDAPRLLRPPRHPPHPFGPRPMPRPRRTAERPWVRCVNPISGFSMPSAIPPTRRRLRRRQIRLPRPVEEALRPRPDLLPLRQLRLLTLSLSAQSLRATTRPRPRLISLPNKPPDQPSDAAPPGSATAAAPTAPPTNPPPAAADRPYALESFLNIFR